eukprot:CAMPEP_0118922436 /NCGR_PEP_ID=MMETSP1169-20130426/1360_1 /TAXON_ID=36882 /ORGANISM="Pyramimonas obovata, Strain CCMP722" /LENGTH=199 /DNA_ID=CAMNT_0006863301 /DNA_START=161 /DNA_END=760 /DNA_ORIENTATION=+
MVEVAEVTKSSKASAKAPMPSICKKDTSRPLDFGWKEIAKLEDIVDKRIAPYKFGAKDKVYKKESNTTLLVGNNFIATLAPLCKIVDSFFFSREKLQWLDVSNNKLTKIEPAILDFPNLIILYMHGNEIERLKEVDKLEPLKNLKKLTLHANPIEEVKNYRMHVCTVLPQLTMLDFINMTKVDRDKAATWHALKFKPKY